MLVVHSELDPQIRPDFVRMYNLLLVVVILVVTGVTLGISILDFFLLA